MANQKKTNYKKWSFLFLVLLIIIDISTYYYVYLDAASGGLSSVDRFIQNLNIIGMVSNLFLLIGIILFILSLIYKEKKNYQYYISIIGYPIVIVQTILVLIQST
ncbi:hypothetical protein [uncultured Aquimarina sp.]|uniref:hypothetical protein n=1 Tax=uncultured Aquimarina sp. TaxID=575652 RepID=UPI002616EEFB|nr:hypothetical protein [uncultured Aquimarina sp.]